MRLCKAHSNYYAKNTPCSLSVNNRRQQEKLDSPGGLAASTWLSELEAALMHAKKAHKAIPKDLVGAKHYTDVAVKALVDALESNRSHLDNNSSSATLRGRRRTRNE